MKHKIDQLLLSFLWIIACALGGCFWFNTFFSFDILSAAHWQYLANMQATRANIKPEFYISVAAFIFITLFGLYLIVRPHIRKIHLPQIKRARAQQKESKKTKSATPPLAPPAPSASQWRPPRLNVSIATAPPAATTVAAAQIAPPASQMPAPAHSLAPAQTDNAALKSIFSDNGFSVKPEKRIKGTQIDLIAINHGEELWLGSYSASPAQMQRVQDEFLQVFSDTLEDVEITINAFIINETPDAISDAASTDVIVFPSLSELQDFVSSHPGASDTTSDDDDNFKAYSEYIDTVLNYIGKI